MTPLAYGLINMITCIGGAILLSLAFGWQIGCGVAMLVYFHKQEG